MNCFPVEAAAPTCRVCKAEWLRSVASALCRRNAAEGKVMIPQGYEFKRDCF